MERLSSFWHWLTTSRYTRHLESENSRLIEINDQLLRALSPAVRQIKTERDTRNEAPVQGNAKTFKW